MAILSNLRRSLVNVINPDKQVQNAVAKAFYSLIGQTYTAYDTNAKAYIEQGYLYNPTVFAVINQRANKAKTVPYYIKKITDESAKKRLDSFRMATKQIYKPHQIIKKAALETKAFEEKMFDFPMEKPNELQSWSDVIALYETFIATTGNFYMYILRGETMTEPQQVYVLPSHLMSIILKKNASTLGTESPISHYMLIEGNQYVEFEAENVIHIKTPNPEFGTNGEHLYGLSPLRAALRNIQSSNLGIDGNVQAMLNSGAFGFIHGKGAVPMTNTQAEGIKDRLQEMDASSERLGKITGVTAELGFTRIALTTDELKPFDYLMFDEKQICNVLGWDNKLLNNDQGAKYDNVEWAEQRTTVNTMIPSLKMFQDAITEKFIPMFKGYDGTIMEFDYSELPEMQIDIGEMVVWLNSALDRGVINRNEFRKAIQYPISEDMDLEVYTVQTDVIPLSEALDENFSVDEPLKDTSLGKPTAGDSQKAGFDPNQPRDEIGRWTDGDRASLKDFEDSIRNQSFETAGVYDEDGNLILKKDGDKNFIIFTEEELMLMRSNKDVVFTHNHPKGYSFSKADIILAYKNNLREMRAVSEGVDHVLVFNSENKPTYMLANGLSSKELAGFYNSAYKKANLVTDAIWENQTAITTDEWLHDLNYQLYHETIINLVETPELKGYLEYKVIKK